MLTIWENNRDKIIPEIPKSKKYTKIKTEMTWVSPKKILLKLKTWGLCPKAIDCKMPLRNIGIIKIDAKMKSFWFVPVWFEIKKEANTKIILARADNTVVDKIAVFPEGIFLEVSRVLQYPMIGINIVEYEITLKIKPQEPYSSRVNVLVIINVKSEPVTMAIIPPINEIRPVYITRIPDIIITKEIV